MSQPHDEPGSSAPTDVDPKAMLPPRLVAIALLVLPASRCSAATLPSSAPDWFTAPAPGARDAVTDPAAMCDILLIFDCLATVLRLFATDLGLIWVYVDGQGAAAGHRDNRRADDPQQ